MALMSGREIIMAMLSRTASVLVSTLALMAAVIRADADAVAKCTQDLDVRQGSADGFYASAHAA